MNIINFYFLILSFLITSPALARLEIKNLSAIDQKELNKKFPNYSSINNFKSADQIVKFLMKTNRFSNVELYKEKNTYLVKLIRPQQINSIVFSGHNKFSTSELEDFISIRNKSRLIPAKVYESANYLKQVYGEHGFLNAEISVEQKKLDNNQVDIHFTINESNLCEINKIHMDSQHKVLNKKLLTHLKKFKNKAFTRDIIDSLKENSVKYLSSRRYITSKVKEIRAEYNPSKTKVDLYYKLSNPIRYEFYFEGNKSISTSSLLGIIGASKHQAESNNPVTKMRRLITQTYLEKGYSLSKVNYSSQIDEDNFVRKVYFQVFEGDRTRIRKFNITGRISKPQDFYSSFIKNNSTGLMSSGYYNKDGLKAGIDNLKTHLKNHGFLQFKKLTQRIEYSKNKKSCTIHLALNEGPQTRIQAVKFSGNDNFTSSELRKVISFNEDDALNLDKFSDSLKLLQKFYFSQGYLEMKITSESNKIIKYSSHARKAILHYEISEGPRILVDSIVIRGNDFTKDYVILREIYFAAGETLTLSKINNSKSQLIRMGLFTTVDIRTVEEGSQERKRTVMITVVERKPGQLKFGIGVNDHNDLTLRGYTGLSYNNIAGTARAISARADIESLVNQGDEISGRFSLSYLEPHLLGSKVRGRITALISKEILAVENKNVSINGSSVAKDVLKITEGSEINFVLEHNFTPEIKASWLFWGLENSDFYEKPSSSAAAKKIHVAQIGPSIDIDHRDDPFLPTKGYYSHLNLNYASEELGSSDLIRFLKAEAQFSFYLRILGSKKWVFATLLKGGYISNLHNAPNSGIPINNTFFLGGYSSLRGFGGSSILERIPNGIELPIDPQTQPNQLIVTDNIQYKLIKTEIRFPIKGNLGGVVFYDAGEVKIDDREQQKSWRQAVGLGVRYNSPVGPIVLDYARKVSPQTYSSPFSADKQAEKKARIHFSIGTF